MKSSLISRREFLHLSGYATGIAAFPTVIPSLARGRATWNTAKDKYILTPQPPAAPRINGASVFGARPGRLFFHTVAATGERPMSYKANGLSRGLQIGKMTGRITGITYHVGTHLVNLKVSNRAGTATKFLKIVIGNKICLTPPMGWNSWNAWGNNITQEQVAVTAKALVDTGLINHGWSFVNIDVSWEGERGGRYNAIQPNDKFPDMKGLCDYVHSLGLKIGIFSTPWVKTYCDYTGG